MIVVAKTFVPVVRRPTGGSACLLSSLAGQEPKATLVTIPASSYAEKARWALLIAKIPFVEEKWAPWFAYLSTKPKGGRFVPLLALSSSPKTILTDSADIVAFCTKEYPDLYPNEKAKDLEKVFDAKIGPHARCCAYYVRFQDFQTSKKVMADPIDSFVQRSVVHLLFPVLRRILVQGLNINETTAERSWSRIEGVLKEAVKELGDGPIGTLFLAGDTFSAADIAFCSHVALLVLPPEHEFISPYVSMDSIQDPIFLERFEHIPHSRIGQLCDLVLQE